MTSKKLRPRPWSDVVASLRMLGVEVLYEDDDHVVLVRGGVKKQAVRKLFNVSIAVQAKVLLAFSISHEEYLRQLPVPSTALVH